MDEHLFKPSKAGVKVALHCFHLFGHFDNDKKKLVCSKSPTIANASLGAKKKWGERGGCEVLFVRLQECLPLIGEHLQSLNA